MSDYANFIQDFPKRSIEVLEINYEKAKSYDREVTLMLAIAAASITIPFERLRPLNSEHPSGDRSRYKAAKKRFDRIIHSKFLSSDLWNRGEGWEFVEQIEEEEIQKNSIHRWARTEIRQPLSADEKVYSVLSHIRNSFSHGSIFTFPERIKEDQPVQIETLIFLSKCYEKQDIVCKKCNEIFEKRNEPTGKYNILAVSPDNFYIFLKNWVTFLGSLKLEF